MSVWWYHWEKIIFSLSYLKKFYFIDWQVNTSPCLENDFQYLGGPGHCPGRLLSDLAVPGVYLGVIPTPLEDGSIISLSQTCYYFHTPSNLGPFPLSDSHLLLSSPRLRRYALIFICSFIQCVFMEYSVTSHAFLWGHHGEEREIW